MKSPDTHDRGRTKGNEVVCRITPKEGIKEKANKRVGRIEGTGGRWVIKGESHREDERKEGLMK